MIFNMNMSVHQSSSSGVAKLASSVVHTWVRPRHNFLVGSHDYCHAPLGVSSFSFSAYKMYGNGHRVAGPEAAIFDEDHMQGGLGACSPRTIFEIRCSEIASVAMFEPKCY